jgi:hypothetical protein
MFERDEYGNTFWDRYSDIINICVFVLSPFSLGVLVGILICAIHGK